MISFIYPIVLIFIPLSFLLYFFIKQSTKNEELFSHDMVKILVKNTKFSTKKYKDILLITSLVFALLALSRPSIKGKEIEVKSSSYELIVGFDISQSMKCNDLYPSRLEFSKNKFINLLSMIKEAKIAIIGFSSQSFLVSPTSSDYDSLKFLVKNLDTSFISLKGTSIMSALKSANDLFDKSSKSKALLLFSDGGDKNDYEKEIKYAKQHNIKVYIYLSATKKGGMIKDKDGILHDKQGNIVILKANKKIKTLAFETGGSYLEYSYDKNDIKLISDTIYDKFKGDLKSSSKKVIDSIELFIYPLFLSILSIFLSLFSLTRREK